MVWQFQGQKLKNKAQQSFNDTSKTKLLVLCVAHLKLVLLDYMQQGEFFNGHVEVKCTFSRLQSTYWWPFLRIAKAPRPSCKRKKRGWLQEFKPASKEEKTLSLLKMLRCSWKTDVVLVDDWLSTRLVLNAIIWKAPICWHLSRKKTKYLEICQRTPSLSTVIHCSSSSFSGPCRSFISCFMIMVVLLWNGFILWQPGLLALKHVEVDVCA